nr:MAG TPA: hypothetical protein [Caudoviricetes sp.]
MFISFLFSFILAYIFTNVNTCDIIFMYKNNIKK